MNIRCMSLVMKQIKSITLKGLAQASFDCDNCNKSLKNPECKACHKMVNYFNIFKIPQDYNINQSIINEKAKTLQKEFHPDKNNISDQKQKFAQYSAYINSAKSTLLDDLKRAVYLMQLKGVNIEEESDIQDTSFMVDMFELQEEIQEADAKEAVKIKQRVEQILQEVKKDFEQFFKCEDLQKCKEFVFKYKYLHRALENVKAKIHPYQH